MTSYRNTAPYFEIERQAQDPDYMPPEQRINRPTAIQPYQPQLPVVARRDTYIPARVEREPVDHTPAWLVERQPLVIDGALTPQVTSMEQSGPLARAKALQLRLWPLLGLYAILAVVIAVLVWLLAAQWPAGALAGALVFVALGSLTYLRLNAEDYAHSAHGTERHRIDTAADLAHARMDHEHELRKMALETYLETLKHVHR